MTAESTIAAAHRDPGDPKYIVLAANILACHNNNRVEANITSAVHDFLLLTNLAGTAGVATRLDQLRQERGLTLTVTVARQELRKWLRESPEGKAVGQAVAEFLFGG